MTTFKWYSFTSYVDVLWYLLQEKSSNSPSVSAATKSESWRNFLWPLNLILVPSEPPREIPTPNPTFAPQPQTATSGRPPLFALTIGIDNYADESLTKLRGAVADADAVVNYLEDDLMVAPDHIISLRNNSASRQDIIDAFKRLHGDARIKPGYPILIYFAGHGGELKGNTHTTQTIFPQDYIKDGEVKPIPDTTIARLLNNLSDKHGNNITVIFDCCHSGSGTRGNNEGSPTRIRSGVVEPQDLPASLDCDIHGYNRGVQVANGFAHRYIRSHVLLAACSADELAREDEGRGRFTVALLALLRRVGREKLAYAEVLDRIGPIPDQNPQCEGFFRDRIFFDAKVPSRNRFCFNIKVDAGKYILQAGSAHGITPGAEFTVYATKEDVLAKRVLAVMTTLKPSTNKTLQAFITYLDIIPLISSSSLPSAGTLVAVQTRLGDSEDFRLHVPIEQSCQPIFEAVLKEMTGEGPDPCRVSLVKRKDAQMEMAMTADGTLRFNVLDERLVKYGIEQIPHSLESDIAADRLTVILKAAAHFTFHLNHTHENNQIQSKIKFKFMKLEESKTDCDDDGYPLLAPVGGDLIRDGVVDFVPEEQAWYGMEITNNTPWDLYMHCMFFDNMDLSIAAFTDVDNRSTGQYRKDCTLKKGGVAGLGYGSLGVPPFQWDIPKGLDIAAGFFKFYFTTEAIDLSRVPQDSPFNDARSAKQPKRQPQPTWGTVLMPVIYRR